MKIHADFHIHGLYSMATSKNMTFPVLASEGKRKGLHLIATGDCLHGKWLSMIKEMKDDGSGLLEMDDMRFILSTEVEDMRRVHHLLYFPELSKVEEFREAVAPKSPNLDEDGRPNLSMGGEEIAQLAKDCEALVGPAHAFTPWTAIYSAHDSLESCYGDMVGYVSFLELGLSADSSYSDRISPHHRLTYLTNSDSHSPYITRIAREFNILELDGLNFDNVKKAFLRQGGQKFARNVGFPPQLGKYNQTACISCFKQYSLKDAQIKRWKCACGKRIKKGVFGRVEELADLEEPRTPAHRPDYIHLLPLSKIIARAIGVKGETSKKVVARWEELVGALGNEIDILLYSDFEDIERATIPDIARAIQLFREKKIKLIPGGGGQYGDIELSPEEDSGETGGSVSYDRTGGPLAGQVAEGGDKGEGKQTTLF